MDLSHVMKLIIASSKTLKDCVHGHNTFSFLMQLTSLSVLRIKIAQVVLMLTYMYMHVDIDLFTTDETKLTTLISNGIKVGYYNTLVLLSHIQFYFVSISSPL